MFVVRTEPRDEPSNLYPKMVIFYQQKYFSVLGFIASVHPGIIIVNITYLELPFAARHNKILPTKHTM